MNLSIVIASYAQSEYHKGLTLKAIKTAKECGISDIVVVETMPGVTFDGVTNILYPQGEKFNYNKCLNIGISAAKEQYIALCNNDVEFHKGFERIADYMSYNDLLSASPYTQYAHKHLFKRGDHMVYGYRICIEMAGWCIVINRDILPLIGGKLDETYLFWWSDNAYADQLIKAGIKHALLCNVSVDHVQSATLQALPKGVTIEMTLHQQMKYRQNAKSKLHIKQS